MLGQQWGAPSKKRARDEDGDGDVAIGGTEGFTEHRNVRLHASDCSNMGPAALLALQCGLPISDFVFAN